jgi:iron(III) transport system substrate-binding protein
VVDANVPAIYRDPEGHWFGLTRRARLLVVSAKRVAASTITYEELAEPRWKGKVCIRSGKRPYNLALIASMLAHHGPQTAEAGLAGLRQKLARKPVGGDRDQIRAVIQGECDLAVVPLHMVGALRQDALKLVQAVRFDKGPDNLPLR